MLEIVRGRNWSVPHTVYDNVGGPLSDLSHLVEFRCQIRQKTAVRNPKGFFEHPLVITASASVDDSVLTLSLTAAETTTLQTGEYILDCVGLTSEGDSESLLDPEPVKVVNRPTLTA
jgi:hypothetical protein